jgi:catechol 2,3-dioxygenase-like lactoylglutathione lyase family enzyme
MPIRSFDHVAIPIQNTAAMLAFYRALRFGVKEREHFYSVHFGDQKINFHAPERWQSGRFTLRGPTAVPGCGDFCFVWEGSAESLRAMLDQPARKSSKVRWSAWAGAITAAPKLPASTYATPTRIYWSS